MRTRNRDLPACSIAPRPFMLLYALVCGNTLLRNTTSEVFTFLNITITVLCRNEIRLIGTNVSVQPAAVTF
jgi:hypothetical protein